tara:strand:+ start:462 stop:638 length:177 start_codon:yes stop_codon:yes gene_type:complete
MNEENKQEAAINLDGETIAINEDHKYLHIDNTGDVKSITEMPSGDYLIFKCIGRIEIT